MIRTKVEVDARRAIGGLRFMANKQVPFATAVACTRLAEKGRDELRESLPRFFTIRRGWVSRGIRIKAGKKSDWPDIASEVGTVDPFMPMHVFGGLKRRDGHDVVIPLNVRSSKDQVVPKSKWPKQLLSKPAKRRPFLVKFKSGKRAVVQRTGRKRLPLRVLYTFKSSIHMKDRWPLERIVRESVNANFTSVFSAAMNDALNTSRPK